MLAHRKYRRPRSLTHLIDHIFGARITLILLFASLFYYAEPKEHHRKTRLTKNEEMTIALAEDMARSTIDLSDEFSERWLELRCCFSVSLTLLCTNVQRLLLILILLFQFSFVSPLCPLYFRPSYSVLKYKAL